MLNTLCSEMITGSAPLPHMIQTTMKRLLVRTHLFARWAVLCSALFASFSTQLIAQSGAPLQQEFSQPDAPAGAQVNTFTGSFSFGLPVLTVPGPNGSDYTLNLSYYSGTAPEQGASWVGYGWSLNAGAIVRDVNGLPDDWKDSVKIWNKTKTNWTVSASSRVGIESQSKDFGLGGQLAYTATVSYNNETGYRRSYGFGVESKGIAGLDYTDADGQDRWMFHVSPQLFLWGLGRVGWTEALEGILGATATNIGLNTLVGGSVDYANRALFSIKDEEHSLPMQLSPRYTGRSTNYGKGLLVSVLPQFNIGPEIGDGGNYTSRTPIASYWLKGLGSMYSAGAGSSDMLDYVSERNGKYRVGDNFLPTPLSGADNYYVSNGAPTGSLRLITQRSGEFRPDYARNEMDIDQAVPEMILGLRLGFGVSLGLGEHSLASSQWNAGTRNSEYRFDTLNDETIFFRYTNDLGGNVLKAHDDRAVRAEIEDGEPKITPNIFALMNGGERSGRTTYVGFNLNKKLDDATDRGVPYYAYQKSAELTTSHAFIQRSENAITHQIGEIAVTSPGGTRYVYGLPVYARKEKRLNFGVAKTSLDSSASRIQGHHIVYSWIDTSTATLVVGEERNAPYAAAHLLTAITTPDYVDLQHDGPTPDDLGGYVKFNYTRITGSEVKSDTSTSANWYHWRAPYRGLIYARNSLSDPDDDMGSFTGGEREQYYMESVETKTHIAILVNNATAKSWGSRYITGSGKPRPDAYQAPYALPEYIGTNFMMAASGDSMASYAQWIPKVGVTRSPASTFARRLERIELYTKNADGNPDSLLSTVMFDYDYSLRPGMPNSVTPHPDSTTRRGMLTLKRLWVENQRVRNQRISPYEFGYEYKKGSDYPLSVRQLYPEVAHFADSLSAAEQNPSYSSLDIDRWGGYQYNGAARRALDNPWVDQNPDYKKFDPAAWQMKWIKMPSQGELHIQYEQSDYSYVQDKPALAMVSLMPTFGASSSTDGTNSSKYYLRMADLGVNDTDRATFFRYRSLIKKYYLDTDDRIYCRLLYALVGDSANFAHPEYNSEYINAYTKADSVGIDSTTVGGVKHYALFIKFGTGDYSVPKSVCLDFVKWNRRGRFQRGAPFSHFGNDRATVSAVLSKYGEAGFDPGNYCKAIDYAHSFLRIPILAPKKGGGIRVKRLLTFDKGIERDSMVYGTEYIYQTYDESRREYISSGVAANEPSWGREENALVNVDPARGREKFITKIIAADDRLQYEGPIGEGLLPGASVGYSRVVVKNIYAGRTNPGFAVEEFYTAKDFPFANYDSLYGTSVDYTDIGVDENSGSPLWSLLTGAAGSLGKKVGKEGALGAGFRRTETNVNLTQGYRFIINSMHGQPKSSASYGGDYSQPESWALSSQTQYQYYRPGEKIPVVRRIGDSIELNDLGKEMDVIFDSRAIEDHTTDLSVNADISIPVFAPWSPITWSVAASLQILNNNLRTHVTTKVIRYPAIQKSVLTYGDGIYHMAENVAFDAESGAPLITKTVDGYDKLTLEESPTGHTGAYHSYSFPMNQEFPLTGQKAANQRAVLTNGGGLSITKAALGSGRAKLTFSSGIGIGSAALGAIARLYPGDLIRLTKASNGAVAGYYHVASKSGGTAMLHPVSPTTFASYDTSTGLVNIEVLESGRTNEIGGGIASIVTYGESDNVVKTASNFVTVEPAEFTARRKFVDTLNAVLNRGGGFIYPSVIAPLGVKFLKTVTSGDTCAALSDTLRLAVREGKVILTRGAFTTSDSICGSALSPHPLIGHLNHLLDSLWGHRIDTTFSSVSQCDSTTYKYRHYDTIPGAYKTFRDSMFTLRFDCVNYLDNYWIGDLVRVGADADTVIEAFKRGTNGYYSATGTIDLQSVLDNTWMKVRLWVSDCDTAGKVTGASFRRGHRFFGGSPFDLTAPYIPFSKAQLDGFFPFTTAIGKFRESNDGYLEYENIFDGNAGKVFGIRFIHGDTSATRLVCADTLVRVGGAGRFDLDDDGSLIYIAADANLDEQEIPCLEFCPTAPYRYKKIEGVIAASAGIITDSSAVPTSDYPEVPSDANPYERGAKGRWRSRIGYAYRTSVIGGSQHNSATQRNYNDAGVFTSFRLYDFKNPRANDTTAWVKGDSVVKYSPNGIPLETRSPLGIRSAMKLGHDEILPAIVAANATYDGIAFSSFEDDTTSQYSARDVAHAGRYSKGTLVTANEIITDLTFKVTQQLKQKGALIRFWMKTDGTIVDTGAATVELKLNFGSSTLSYPIRTDNKIARTGEWTLYEVIASNITVAVGTSAEVEFETTFTDTNVYVDDIKVQPTDAAAVCFVYDGRTYRPLASFDDDHFGAYSQYNAEGRVVRTIVETARGVRTVAEAHAHMPMTARPTPGSLMMPASDGNSEGHGVARRSRRPLPEVEEEIEGTKVDLLDVELGLDKPKVKLLGGEKPELPDLEKIAPPDPNAIKTPEGAELLKKAEQAKLIMQLRELERERKELIDRGARELSEEERKAVDAERKRIEEKRAELIRRLNLPESELRAIYDAIEEASDEK